MIYVRTCAYNAEKTLERTIKSILNQTYEDFLYYILDNGSTDATREIIRRYAAEDGRIVPFYSDRNFDQENNPEFWSLFYTVPEGNYFCVLDADDVYAVTFLEETLRFLTENELDIAMCGTVFMDADTWTPLGERVLLADLVIKDAVAFENCFPEIYWNLRAVWGKLYTAEAAARSPYRRGAELEAWWPSYGGDTINTFEILEQTERIGILARPLHYYALSQTSVSYRWAERREKSDPLLFQKGEELLLKKCGRVSPENYRMLYAVYFNALCDTFRVLFGAGLPAGKKVAITKEIFFHPITQKMFTMQFDVPDENRIVFFIDVVSKLLELWEKDGEQDYAAYEAIFANINPDYPRLITKEGFLWHMGNYPLILRNVVLREYEYALNNLLMYLSKKETQPTHDFPYVLGQTLAAMREEEQKYILFSKWLMAWRIANQQMERARKELAEWREMLPEDEDIRAMIRLCGTGDIPRPI